MTFAIITTNTATNNKNHYYYIQVNYFISMLAHTHIGLLFMLLEGRKDKMCIVSDIFQALI